MVEDYKKFLSIKKNQKPYLIEFEEDKLIKTKKYLSDYIVEEDKYNLIIIITYNKYIFFANNGIWKA